MVPSWVSVEPRPCGGALLLPRHRHGAALLNDERPATPGAEGHGPSSRKSSAPGRAPRHSPQCLDRPRAVTGRSAQVGPPNDGHRGAPSLICASGAKAAVASPALAARRPSTSDSGPSRHYAARSTSRVGRCHTPDELVPDPAARQHSDVREQRAENLSRSRRDPRPLRSVRSNQARKPMTRTTSAESTQTRPVNVGFLATQGAFRTHQESSGYVSSRAPSGAGRSPYNSEPSIEARDSTTTLRRIGGETPAITHHPHQQAIAGCASRPPSQAAGGPAAPTVPGTPKRSGQGVCASVEAGVAGCGSGRLPKSPGEIRSYSGLGRVFRPLSLGLRPAGVVSSTSPKPGLGVSPPPQV